MPLVTVIGATGNIGRVLTHRLLLSGNSVRAVARSGEKLQEFVARGADARPGNVLDVA